MPKLSADEVRRRMPTLQLIDDPEIREQVGRLTETAPEYFWHVPASTSGYHHPACTEDRGLWAHTLMLSTVIDRLSDSYVGQNRLSEHDIDLAHAAAILHDQRKNGDPETPSDKSVSDHDLRMARVVHESELADRVAGAIASHMGAWYDGPDPETDLQDLVHTADMVASTASITPAVQGPIPDELDHCELEAADLL